ncbi:MAG: Sua5/YciO/YrdC/YwlC family protein [Kiritimatiellae bacterium]|nr:Sua5/YciO/YrdC/YwlC family protein [Kiritimatiellia bacterium]
MQIIKASDDTTETLAMALKSGAVAVIPTDTVYGLAAHPDCPDAVARLYTIKGREAKKPIAMLADSAETLARRGFALAGQAAALAERHWPGALTLVIQDRNGAWEGLRVPNHAWTRRLIASCGGLLRVTSANLSGQRPATDAPAALKEVGLSADFVVDDGTSPGGTASTVVKAFPDGSLEILRPGAIRL